MEFGDSAALRYAKNAYGMFEEIPDSLGMAYMSNILGSIYTEKQMNTEALDNFFSGKEKK